MASRYAQLQALRDMLFGARVTQPFGPSDLPGEPTYVDPITGRSYPNFHMGVDLVLPDPTGSGHPEVRSPASGRVIFAGNTGNGFGNFVKIQAPNGFVYILAHLSDLSSVLYGSGRGPQSLQTGDLVHAGDIIGHEGGVPGEQGAGYSTGRHLHFEVHAPNGQPVDLGRTGNNVFYTIYHDLGFGAGYPEGSQYDVIPDPLQRNQLPPVPNPLPFNPGATTTNPDTRWLPGVGLTTNGPLGEGTGDFTGTSDQSGYWNTVGGAAAQSGANALNIFSFLSRPGGLFGKAPTSSPSDQTSGASGTGTSGDVAFPGTPVLDQSGAIVAFLGTFTVGIVLLIAGLRGLGKEKPVQVITQPVADVGKGVAKGAKLAAVAA